ncbi:MAG: hypothetical protein RLZZ367_2335 [Bacteroidota bacterium]|jgi:gliding motility-associated-like protein
MKPALILLLTLLHIQLSAQVNLVPNPGFEDYTVCPTGYTTDVNQFNSMLGNWYCPTMATSDYFNICATTTQSSVPSNMFGYRQPHSGNGYTGIIMYVQDETQDYCEFLQTRLTQKLEAGEYYCVSFYVSVPDSMPYRFTTYAIGASLMPFADVNYQAGWGYKLFFTPVISNPVNNYIRPADGWVKVSGTYRAIGNEEYLTIGNYTEDDSTPVSIVVPTGTENKIYFLIDDVSVIKLETMKDDTLVCRTDLPQLVLTADTSITGYIWNTGETVRTITPTDSGWYWVMYDPGCGMPLRDSTYVTVLNNPQFILPADTFLCAGELLTLAATQTGGVPDSYNWNTGNTAPLQAITDSGGYVLQVTNSCGVFTDSVHVAMDSRPVVELPATLNLCVDNQLQPLTITAHSSPGSYLWSTGDTTETLTINTPGQYWFSSQNQCGVTRAYLNAQDCPLPFATVYIPNAFSPNGDGNNDVWMVYTDSVKVTSIEVYDRWGEKVFENTVNAGWDGHYKGVLQPAGVYVYYIRCSDMVTTEPRHYKGSLTLVR